MQHQRRLTRNEIDLLLKRDHGSKKKLATLAGVSSFHVSRWLHSVWRSRKIERVAESFALEIAHREQLREGDIYVDEPNRKPPITECRTQRASLFV